MNLTIFNTSTAHIIKEEFVTLQNCLDYSASINKELLTAKIILLFVVILLFYYFIQYKKYKNLYFYRIKI